MAKDKSWWGGSKDSSSSSKGYKSSFFDWDSWKSPATYKTVLRKEIVQPYMNWYDSRKVIDGVYGDQEFMTTQAQVLAKAAGKAATGDTVKQVKDTYQKLVPDHLIQDIYSIYYNKSKDIKFAELKDSNIVKFKILQNVNNSLLKPISNGNAMASFMYAKQISHFLFEEFLKSLTDKEKEELEKSMKDCNSGEGESKDKKDGDKSDGQGKGKGKPDKSGNKPDGKGEKESGSGGESEDDDDSDESDGDDQQDQDNGDQDGDGTDSDGEGDEGEDGDNEGNNQSNQSKSPGGKNAGKSGHRNNPLTGHNAKENVDPANNRKKEQQKPQTLQDRLGEKIDNMFSKPDIQQRMDEAIGKADKLMSDLEKAGLDMSKDGLGQIATIANMKQLRDDIAALSVNKRAIIDAIKNVLDNSKNYFSKKCTVIEVDFMEADEIDEIYGMEYIHPVFKSMMLDRLTTEERKPLGKIDLFIDISGSMGSNSGIPGVSNMLFAKSIALAMYKMDLLNNLYTFDTRVTKIEVNEVNILLIGYGGGTSIETVVRHVQNISKNNAICLTDGEDTVNTYDDKMFFMGTVGVVFSSFSGSEAGKKYIESNQCINFDGNKTEKITKKMLSDRGGYWYQKW